MALRLQPQHGPLRIPRADLGIAALVSPDAGSAKGGAAPTPAAPALIATASPMASRATPLLPFGAWMGMVLPFFCLKPSGFRSTPPPARL